MNTDKLLENVEIIKIHGKIPQYVDDITDYSENVKSDGLFFCVNGNNTNGKNYIKDVENRGAKLIVGEEYCETEVCFLVVKDIKKAMAQICKNYFGEPQKSMKITGVVGTNGKTSICHILSRIFEYSGKKTAVIGTLGVTVNGITEETGLTSLGIIRLYKTLAKLRDEHVEWLFMEVSAHAIEQRRIEGLFFEGLIFSNCTEDHLDYFKNFTTYENTKVSVFNSDICKFAVVNSDDETGRKIINRASVKTISYAVYNPSDVFAIDIAQNENGISYIINLFDIIYDIKCPLIGMCNVYNTLAAVSFAATEGLKIHKISGALKSMSAISGRAEYVCTIRDARIYLDYAHTPDGLKRTLSSFRKICSGRLICLFGCGGNREKEKRSIMGEISGVLCDFTVITTDNPRYEDPYSIISEIESGIRRVSLQYITITDRRSAIEYAVSKLKRGDILVVAGKGAETYQEIMGVKHDFSDKQILNEIAISCSGESIG